MDLPLNIEQKVIEYLNIEYGATASEGLNPSDLSYVGEVDTEGTTRLYWRYPCQDASGCWVTVEPYEGSYMISMTTIAPTRK